MQTLQAAYCPQVSQTQFDIRIYLWTQYEIAARKIQRQFRCWNVSRHFRRSYTRKKWIIAAQPKKAKRSLEQSFREVIQGTSDFDDNMAFWRGIIELRRAHSSHSTDTAIRALIEAKGDLNRAISLLGTKDFVQLNSANIAMKLRKLLLPNVQGKSINGIGTDGSNSHNNTSSHHINSSTNRKLGLQLSGSFDAQLRDIMMFTFQRTPGLKVGGSIEDPNGDNDETAADTESNRRFNASRVAMVRSLREASIRKGGNNTSTSITNVIYEQDREERRKELVNLIASVTLRAYFSKNHFGTKDYKKQQLIASSSVTAKSKEILRRFDDIQVSGNLNHLLPNKQIF